MVYGARTGVPFAIGLMASALVSLFFPVQHDFKSCNLADSDRVADANGGYVYTARDWRVEQRKPPLVSSAVNDAPSSKVIRARFAATELGTRERLVVIIFGQSALSGALSALLTTHVSRVQIFMEASRVDSETGTLPNLTPYRQYGQHAHVHVLNSIFNLTFHENYDWFLLISERSYVNPFALGRLIDELSWSTARAVGRHANDGKCRFDAGILLSNPAIQLLIQQRHLCSSITASSDETALEMCIQHAANLTCSENERATPFHWWHFEDGGEAGTAIHERVPALRHSEVFNASITVSPLLSELDARVLHAHFISVELTRIDAQIDEIAGTLSENERKFLRRQLANYNDSELTASSSTTDLLSWPVGMPHPIKPSNRYQVPVWDYFTENQLFYNWPNHNVEVLRGEDALDVADVVARAREHIEHAGSDAPHLNFMRLRNGYRSFNALRGMEYVVDLEYKCVSKCNASAVLLQRVHLCRPIAASELIESVPYVKEDTDITLVIPVEHMKEVDATRRLLARQARQCDVDAADRNSISDKRQTRFVVAMRGVDATVAHQLNEDLATLKRRCKTWHIEASLLALNPAGGSKVTPDNTRPISLRVAAMDEAVDHYGQQTIYALLSPYADYQREFLDRVRISTIRRYQVFSPIPFAEFHPLISKADEILQKQRVSATTPHQLRDDADSSGDVDNVAWHVAYAAQILRNAARNFSLEEWPLVVHKDRGFFDANDFSMFSVYGTDYLLMRERFFAGQNDNKQQKDDKNNNKHDENKNNSSEEPRLVDLEDLFLLTQDQIHVLRAIEPSLRLRYYTRKCVNKSERCMRSALTALGTKAQMANLTFRGIVESINLADPVKFLRLQSVFQQHSSV